jgi:very-short-patch-repair endonuclease
VNARIGPFEVDLCWPAHRLVVETDGHRHHGSRTAFEADRARDAALTADGWRVVRFTDRQVRRDSKTTADLLRRLLADLSGLH